MIGAAVIAISALTLLWMRRVRRRRAAAPAGRPPEQVGMHGALVARRR